MVLTATGVLTGLMPGVAAAGESTPLNSTHIPAKYANQTVDWHLCLDSELPFKPPPEAANMECATYRTPRDWHRLDDQRDLTIAISRLPSKGPATESVLINPGGPGAAGRIWPARMRFQDRVLANQEIIGFDPRGTGMSTSISCGGALDEPEHLDPRDRDPENLNLILDTTKSAVNTCLERTGELGPLINTDQTVRDLDLLRVLLRRPKVNWVGYSAGTWLGVHYAHTFPTRVNRIVLDSSVEFTTSWERAFAWQPMSFERRWRQDFLPWLAKNDKVYGFGSTAEAARQGFEDLRRALGVRPVDYNGLKVGPNILDSFAAEGIYSKLQFAQTAQLLVDLRALTRPDTTADQKTAAVERVKATQANRLTVETLPAADDSYPTSFWTIRCNEGPWPGDRESVVRQSQQYLDQQQTLVGGKWMVQPCIFWNKPGKPLPVIDGRGLPPVLMLHSVHDPATAIEGARRAHQAFAGSRLVTVSGEGDHGLYAVRLPHNNKDLDELVQDYLVNGTLPAQDITIPGVPLP